MRCGRAYTALVEDDGIEIVGLGRRDQALFELRREGGIILVARQALFLDRTDRYTVADKRGRRIVIVRGDAQNLHLNIAP